MKMHLWEPTDKELRQCWDLQYMVKTTHHRKTPIPPVHLMQHQNQCRQEASNSRTGQWGSNTRLAVQEEHQVQPKKKVRFYDDANLEHQKSFLCFLSTNKMMEKTLKSTSQLCAAESVKTKWREIPRQHCKLWTSTSIFGYDWCMQLFVHMSSEYCICLHDAHKEKHPCTESIRILWCTKLESQQTGKKCGKSQVIQYVCNKMAKVCTSWSEPK